MKIDITKIEGYADMSPEDKVKALEGFEMPEPDSKEITRLRDALTKSNSEAADYKRQLRARQTDEEAAAQKAAENQAKMEQELAELRKEKSISVTKAKYLALGYPEEMAQQSAEALYGNDLDTVFDNQKKFVDEVRKSASADALKAQPGLSSGKGLGSEGGEDDELRAAMGLPPKQ